MSKGFKWSLLVLLICILVMIFWPMISITFPTLNCTKGEININTGHGRHSRYIAFICVSQETYNTALSKVLSNPMKETDTKGWRPVNTFAPPSSLQSPRHRFHSAFNQAEVVESIFNILETPEQKTAFAKLILETWQRTGGDDGVDDIFAKLLGETEVSMDQSSESNTITSSLAYFITATYTNANEISQKQVVSSNDYQSIMTAIASTNDLLTRYTFRRMSYVRHLPGGITTNEIGIKLSDRKNSRRGLSVIYANSNGHWNIQYSQRSYDNIGLLGNVPYGAAEVISRAIEKSVNYGSGHRIELIIGPDSEYFSKTPTAPSFTDTAPPKGTDFIVRLECNKIFSRHNYRIVFVSVDNGLVRFLGKQDSLVIN